MDNRRNTTTDRKEKFPSQDNKGTKKQNNSNILLDKNGKIIPDTKKKLERWTEYVRELFEDERQQEIIQDDANGENGPNITKEEVIYPDDTILIAAPIEDLQRLVDRMMEYSEESGLRLNGQDTNSFDSESSKEDALQNIPPSNPPANKHDLVSWDDVDDQFVHCMKIPDDKACVILADLNRSSSELDIFSKLFPKSLLQYIAQGTNRRRLEILEQATNRKEKRIDTHEIMIFGISSLKPIKRGIKIWERCDSRTGYVYDFDIYLGKESETTEGTLGERVVSFHSPQSGCALQQEKICPIRKKKCKRGEHESMHNNNGTIGYLWMDTKEVMVLSNCYGNESVEISPTGNDGTKNELSCPEAIQLYNSHMGGGTCLIS
ncbi:hypothetical protein ILUMI_26424 [Ignelater luminosus]|uniref:PiggyBac transposable element-derived protein domain-containing protein n=1 Tax=Ignelater luminosus TaxID=2038154 RepID=A0A8K0FYY6_IGNLU|nr:hypothetical protein ILUMI_26424 [Ignelater luminosus]